ncbi:MAG: hypothetical protein ACRC67_08310, partial [Inquilinus sp.]|uniref:hypothetical protein n=1 Tax=Inquilinus sp. TaxID=1932117 RepID=UPI003F34B145
MRTEDLTAPKAHPRAADRPALLELGIVHPDARIDREDGWSARGLHVVADDAGALAAGRHRPRIRVGQRDLLVGSCPDRFLHRPELL